MNTLRQYHFPGLKTDNYKLIFGNGGPRSFIIKHSYNYIAILV